MRSISKICAWSLLMIGPLILAGNFLDIDILRFPAPGMTPARINSGICILLCAIVLLIANTKERKIYHEIIYIICSLLILVLSVFAFTQYTPVQNPGLDPIRYCPGGMSFYSSIIFTLTAISFLFSKRKGKKNLIVPVFLMHAVFFFALFIIFSHIFKASVPVGWYTYSSIPFYTDVSFVLIAIGLISAHPEFRIVKTFASKSTGGFILRSILLPLFIILPALSYLRVLGVEYSYFNAGFGTAIMTIVTLILFTVIITNVCYQLDNKENELIKSERIFRSLVQNVKDYAIFMMDIDGNIITWNEGARRLKGYTKDEILGKHYAVFYPKEALDRNEPERNLEVAANLGHFETEDWRVRKDGSKFFADIVITPVYDKEEKLTGFIKVVRDVTVRKKAAEEKNKLQLLEQKHKELENFTYILSHDVLAPLRNISMLSKWLMEDHADKLNEEGKEFLRLMNDKITLLGGMIDEVLVYIRAGKTSSERTEIDTSLLVKDIIKMQSIPGKTKIVVDTNLPMVVASKTSLKQVFTNLVDNAIKHNDKKEVLINIGCESVDDHWRFYVKDNGPGIAAAEHDRVFEIFRGGGPESGGKGHGIGLATVKRSIENEGGKVWIESEPGKGATFLFTLKKKEEDK